MNTKLIIICLLIKCITESNSQNTINQSFLKHIATHIDINKCINYVGEDWPNFSPRQKSIILQIQNELLSNGIKLYNPIEVMSYNSHSKDLQYTLKDIEIYSKVFNTHFNKSLKEAYAFIQKDKSIKISSQDLYENGKIKTLSKIGPVEDHYSITYDTQEQVITFYFRVKNMFELQYEKDENGVYIRKQLSFLDGNNIFCSFNESISSEEKFYFFSPGSDGSHISVNVKNEQIVDLSVDVSCGCPYGQKPEFGITKTLSTSLIEYSMNNEGIIIYHKWWNNGKYHEYNKIYDIKSNLFYIYEINDASMDTTSIIEGTLALRNSNGQTILYGENPFFQCQISTQERHWTREWYENEEVKYLDYIILFDKNGIEKQMIYYYPNGQIRSIENR